MNKLESINSLVEDTRTQIRDAMGVVIEDKLPNKLSAMAPHLSMALAYLEGMKLIIELVEEGGDHADTVIQE